MNLRQLRTFVAIADSGGLARAEVRLHLSQPAATRQIQALEAALGVVLFDRVGRGMHLTSEGEDLLRRSRRLLLDADSIVERARVLKGGKTGTLRVGATTQVIEATLAGFLPRYQRWHPGVAIHLVEDGGERLPSRLERGDAQLAFVVHDARFVCRPLYPAHGLAVLGKKHRLGARRTLDVAELGDEPLLLLNRDFASRHWFDDACRAAHIDPNILLESAAPQTVIALAAAGYGVAIVPSTVKVPPRDVRIVALVQGRSAIGRWLTIAWDAQRFQPPYAAQFVEEIEAYCRDTYPNREFIKRAPSLPRPQQA